MTLDDRKSAILRAVVQQYVETAQPVGSAAIAERAEVSVSSATVRNELHALESEGYLAQPHTSAGRIPTDKGYRFFVDALTGEESLSPTNVAMVSDFFAAAHGELEQMLRDTTHLLSSLTGTAALITGDHGEAVTLRSVQLIDLHPQVMMVVVVTSTGVVLKRSWDRPIEPGDAPMDLGAAQTLLVDHLVGRPLVEVVTWNPPADHPAAEVAGEAAAAIVAATEAEQSLVYVDGTGRIAGSFDARETIESVLTVLEKQFVVVSLLKELVDGGLTVAIGAESGIAPLSECSLVVAPYQSDSGPAGAIAVLGPTRMDYAQTVSAVVEVSERLSKMLTEG